MGEELEVLQSREAGEEIQLAETKLAMHKEMLEKDEQVTQSQCCGSGSGRIRNYWQDPDTDP